MKKTIWIWHVIRVDIDNDNDHYASAITYKDSQIEIYIKSFPTEIEAKQYYNEMTKKPSDYNYYIDSSEVEIL